MLLYSTILGVNETMTKENFIKLVIEWNQGSPHEENIIKGISWNGEKNARFGDDKLWIEFVEYRNKNIIAVRYEKVAEDGAIWDTDYIMNFDEMRIAIRLDCSYLEEAVVTNAVFSTPHFVTLLIKKGYLRADGDLEVSRNALEINEDNLSVITSVITGKAKYQLPVVYVSKTVYNKDPISVNYLCRKLKGLAHVLLQQDKGTNNSIREACSGANEYNGAIGIYYPNDALGHKRCICREGAEREISDRVVNFVLQYSLLQRLDKLYTWQGVSNSLLYDRFKSQKYERIEAEKARELAENEVEDVYASFDEELSDFRRQVEELTRANEILENENQTLRAKLTQIDRVPIILQGEEEDMYPGEIKDMVLDGVNEALKRCSEETRRAHVLKDILDSNNFEMLTDEKKKEIKRLFKGYSGMTGALRRDLKDLGLTIEEEGKHYKLRLNGDSRYLVSVACTPSDNREGNNVSATICRNMF